MNAKKDSKVETSRGWRGVVVVIRDAAIVVIAATILSVGLNVVREAHIPLVQKEPYEILVPCPEPVGEPAEMQASDPLIRDKTSLVIDARSKGEFAAWHVDGARNQPFDWLGPPVEKEVQQLARDVAASRAHRVVIYGDGDNPDSGLEWARLVSGARIKNVFFVKGGAPALNPRTDPGGGA